MKIQDPYKINVEYVSHSVEADYLDNDICIIDDLKELNQVGIFQMDMIILLACTKGKMQVDVNGKTFFVNEGDLLGCAPNSFFCNQIVSPDFNSKIIGFSYRSFQRMLHLNKDIWNLMIYLGKSPIHHLSEEDKLLMDNYYTLFLFKLKHKDNIYQKPVMNALFQALLYDVVAILTPIIEKKNENNELDIKQGDILLKRFLQILADAQGKERLVTFYANKLYVTPKYLTTVCKMTSGKTALEWIHEYTIEVIIQHLKYSESTIKEISNELGFPNYSFFGKFVKARLGVSPKVYRKSLVKEKE